MGAPRVTPRASSAFAIALLTAVQVAVHIREYKLLVWPARRTPRHIGRPRLTAIVRWETIYYLLLCAWLSWSWLAWNTLPSNWATSAILIFSTSHVLGFWSLRTQRVQLAAAATSAARDSSVAELATMIATEQDKSYPAVMGTIVAFDGLELLVLKASPTMAKAPLGPTPHYWPGQLVIFDRRGARE